MVQAGACVGKAETRSAGKQEDQQNPGFGMIEKIAEAQNNVPDITMDEAAGTEYRHDALVKVGGIEPCGIGAVRLCAIAIDAGWASSCCRDE